MKKEFTRANLEATNVHQAKELSGIQDGLDAYYGLLALLADVADTAITGTDCYCTFGLSRDKKALLLTVNFGHSKLYASGATLDAVSTAAQELLD